MAVNLVTVTGSLETLIGATPSIGRLWFKLNRPDWNLNGDIFAPEYIEAIADPTTGAFSVSLQTTDDLEAGASYSVVLKYREPLDNKDREYIVANFMLPSGGPYQLGDLLTVPFVEPVPADILALCQAYAVAAGTAADAAHAWAESPTPPDPLDPTSKSSKTWAGEAAASAAQAALYDGPWLDTVSALIADTSLTYTPAQPSTVSAGDYVRTRAEGFAYQVAASGAVDQHVTTAGGVKLYVLPGADGWAHLDAFGATRDGTDCSRELQLAVDSFDNVDMTGTGIYGLATEIDLNDLRFLKLRGTGATIRPLTNGMTMFRSTEGPATTNNSYGQSFINLYIKGDGATGVTGFDLYRFVRYASGMQNVMIEGIETGVHFRELCYGALISNLDVFDVENPVIVDQVAGALEFLHPRIDMAGKPGVGIDIKAYAGAGGVENVGTKISGGAVEGGLIGVRDAGYNTQVEGTYFERNSEADISLVSGSFYFSGRATSHTASGGTVAYKGRGADSALIVHPFMSSSARSTGLFDFDGTNKNCYYEAIFGTGSKNLPLGTVTGIHKRTAIPGPIGSVTPDTGAFTTLSTSGRATLAALRTANFSQSIAPSTPTTLFTLSGSVSIGIYRVYAYVAFSGGPAMYTAFADVLWDGNGGRISANDGTSLTLSLSGGDVQVKHAAGTSTTVHAQWLKVG